MKYETLDAFQTVTESSKREIFRTEKTDKEVEGNSFVFRSVTQTSTTGESLNSIAFHHSAVH